MPKDDGLKVYTFRCPATRIIGTEGAEALANI